MQLALETVSDSSYELETKSNNVADIGSKVWRTFKVVRRTADSELMDFVQCQWCKNLFSYRVRNGSNNLKKHLEVCVSKESKKVGKVSIKGSLFKAHITEVEKKAVTKASVRCAQLTYALLQQ